MTLTFLGQKYETAASEIAPNPTELTGKYRGVSTKFSNARSANRSSVTLTYRGISYVK